MQDSSERLRRTIRLRLAVALLAAAGTLGGCVYAPYPGYYRPYYGYYAPGYAYAPYPGYYYGR